MSDLQTIADRVEIEALRGEFTDAVMMRDYDRLASLFTEDGVVRMPHINAEASSREEIRAGIERMQDLWDYFVQNTHPGTIQLEGDTAVGRAYSQSSCTGATASHLNYAVYHDHYQRTPEGWKFAERVYEVRYVDTTPCGLRAVASMARRQYCSLSPLQQTGRPSSGAGARWSMVAQPNAAPSARTAT
jgi:ketosteroid isomerase-like protein